MKEKKSINQIDIHFLHTVEMDKIQEKTNLQKKNANNVYIVVHCLKFLPAIQFNSK